MDWVEAEGNYVSIHTGKKSYLLRETISSLESQLDPKKFIRIHRSSIVNINRIKELQPWSHGEYHVILQDGTQLTLSRSYREKLQAALGNSTAFERAVWAEMARIPYGEMTTYGEVAAAVGEPGMPSASIGRSAEVPAACAAVSGATTPSTLPVPNLSPSGEKRRATP